MAVTVTVKVPVWVGVPLNTPPVDKVNPAGRVLEVVNVTVPIPPAEVKAWLKAVPAVPVVVAGLVTETGWHGMVVVKIPRPCVAAAIVRSEGRYLIISVLTVGKVLLAFHTVLLPSMRDVSHTPVSVAIYARVLSPG